MKVEILIENQGGVQSPVVLEGVTWATERQGVPGRLTFSVLGQEALSIAEGNPVQLLADGVGIFSGFVFSKNWDKNRVISVTAYDQLRYLQNKDTYLYLNKTASQVVKMIAGDFSLTLGDIEETGFVIPTRAEENTMLFDIIGNALDLEYENKKKRFVLYDDFGKLALKSVENRQIPLILDRDTGQNYDYASSIDENSFNKVKLSYEDKKSGNRKIFVAKDPATMESWGILQYFDTLKEGENGDQKAASLLSLYNRKTQRLRVLKAFGDLRVRAGCMISVKLSLGDLEVEDMMLVEKCVHQFRENEHWMDLNLSGGVIIG